MKRAVIAALLCVLGVAAVLGWAAANAATSLRIELTTPTMCEADFDDGEAMPTLEVEWEVTGGTQPYRVAVGNTLSDQAGGVANEICGIWTQDDVDSGVMTVQARVVDANGDAAAAIAHVYAVRVVRSNNLPQGFSGLAAGRVYRVDNLLMTIPAAFGMSVAERRCANGDAACEDIIELHFCCEDPTELNPVIQVSRSERREVLRVVGWHFAYDKAEIHEALNQFAASIGRPPATTTLPSGVAARQPNDLSLKLISPAICDQPQETWKVAPVSISWAVIGGADSRRVVIQGREFAGRSGTVDVPCGVLNGRYADSGLQIVHGTVTDSDGSVASDTAYVYSIASAPAGLLTGGETYRLYSYDSIGLLVTIPPVASVRNEGLGGIACDDGGHCEDQQQFSLKEDGAGAFVSIGIETGTEGWRRTGGLACAKVYESDCAEDPSPSHPIHSRIDALLASIGRPPELPPEHRDQLTPLTITAYADPPGCVTGELALNNAILGPSSSAGRSAGTTYAGGAVNLHLHVVGGFWAPITVTVDNADVDDRKVILGSNYANVRLAGITEGRLFRKSCTEAPGTIAVALHAQDRSDPPQQADGSASLQIFPKIGDDDRVALSAIPHLTGFCTPGGQVELWWGAAGDDASARLIVAVQGLDGLQPATGRAWVQCQSDVGRQVVWVMAADPDDSRHVAAVPVLLMVVDDPPVPNALFASLGALPIGCEPGAKITVAWSAIGGLAPYTVRSGRVVRSGSVGPNTIQTVCPPRHWAFPEFGVLEIGVSDSAATPRIVVDRFPFPLSEMTPGASP